MKVFRAGVALAGLMLAGCQQAPAQAAGGTIEAVNHTRWAINHFSVNGQSGLDIIGPHQGGGGRLLLQGAGAVAAGHDGEN